MTIVVAWTRAVANTYELLLASDSRLSGLPGHVDYCQKLFPLSRDDVAIGFCGQTTIAYPFILQVINYVNQYLRARTRGLDICDMRGRLLEILNDFRSSHIDPIGFNDDNLETQFILAGWSWKKQDFDISIFHYDLARLAYTFRPSTVWRGQGDHRAGRGKRIAIAGDYTDSFRKKLISRLREKGKLTTGGFDMEPFEVLVDMLKDKAFITRDKLSKGVIGGSPQFLKIYRYCATLPFGVRWGNPERKIHVFGRPLLHYEVTTLPILDSDSLVVTYPLQSISNAPDTHPGPDANGAVSDPG